MWFSEISSLHGGRLRFHEHPWKPKAQRSCRDHLQVPGRASAVIPLNDCNLLIYRVVARLLLR